MRHPWAIMLLVLLAGGLVAWYLHERTPPAADDAGVDQAPGDASPDAASLEGHGADGATAAGAGPEAQPPLGPDADPTSRPPVRGFVLRGRLVGPSPLPGEVQAHFADEWGRAGRETARVAVDGEGRFRIAVAEELGAFQEPWLVVEVDAPAFMPTTRTIARREFVRDVEHVRRASTEIVLRRAGSITGRVVNETDEPIGGAEVALIVRTKVYVAPAILDVARTDPAGRYVLRAPRSGAFELVAVAEGMRPERRVVQIELGRAQEGPSIRLVEGAIVSGRLLGRGSGVEGAWVAAAPEEDDGDGDVWSLGAFQLALRGDRVVHHPALAETAADGRFRLKGLHAGAVRIGVEAGRDALLHPQVLERIERRTQAPAHGIELQLGLARILVEVRMDGQPVPDAEVSWAAIGPLPGRDPDDLEADDYILWQSMSTQSSPEGRASLGVSAGGLYAVSATREGYRPATQQVRAPADGVDEVVVLELAKAAPKPVLELRFQGDGADALAKAYVATLAPGADAEKQVVPSGRTVEVEDRRARYEVEQRGSHLYVHPGAEYGTSVGYWLPVVIELDRDATGTPTLTVPLRSGCGLELDVRDTQGGPARVRCRIESASGTPQRVWFVRHERGGVIITGHSLEGPSSIHPPLPKGTYTIVLWREGQEPLRKPVKLEPGKAVHVTLTY